MKPIWSPDDVLRAATFTPNRRAFLGTAGMAAVGAFAGPFLPRPAFAAGGELQIMAWEGFDLTTQLADWRKQNGVTVDVSVIGNQDDVHSKFVSGNPPPFDLAEYNQGYSDLYIDVLKITKPLDPAKLPNYSPENIFSVFYNQPTWYRNGNLYGVPWTWGINSLVYNPAEMEKPASYNDLLKPELQGRIALVDDTLATWPAAASLVGLKDKYPNLTKEEMARVFENLKKFRDHSRVISLTYGDLVSLFVSGEVVAVFSGWVGVPVETAKQNVRTEYVIPAEGANTWCDAWFTPTPVDNPDTAHEFINMSLDPKVQAEVAMAVTAGVVSPKAVAGLDEKARAMFDYSDIEGVFRSSPLFGIPPQSSDVYATYADWVAAWNEFKVG